METSIIELPDGRELAFSEAGAPAGVPVLAFHGTPGSRRQLLLASVGEVAHRLGVRLIAPDRPGYGHSTFQPRRRLTDWPADVELLADYLGIEQFRVMGYSGGGPHALACAAHMPGRVARAAVVSGVGAITTAADTEGMTRSNQALSAVARRSERALVPVAAAMTQFARHRPERAMRSMSKELPPCDVAVVDRPEVRQSFLADIRLASGTTARAVAQDMTLFTRPWGFGLHDIRVPVDFWQGDADRNVPPGHAQRQVEQVGEAVLHEVPGEGHLMVYDHIEEILQAALV